MIEKIKDICNQFQINGEFKDYTTFNSGHINSTFLLNFDCDGKQKEYVLQKINKNVFKNPEQVMENISNVTNYIKDKIKSQGGSASRKVLHFLKSNNDKYYSTDSNGEYWRMYKFVNNSITFNNPNLKTLNETGKAFGDFQNMLSDYPIEDLNIIIPHFHNTENRYKIFEQVLNADEYSRAEDAQNEIYEYLKLKNIACKMYRMQKNGELDLRVTHNDTKSNNVLFDSNTGEYLCVIDLDTVMPGLIGFDFGDAIRFGASTASESETNLDSVGLDLQKFQAFTQGFLSSVGNSLTKNEINTLSLGAITMTVECGLRFLTDYLDGDNYFKIDYPEHNLNRSKCQLKLAQSMIQNYNKMQEIVKECVKKYNINPQI